MVCDRCKKVVEDELKALGVTVFSTELGRVKIKDCDTSISQKIESTLSKQGFELIKDAESQLADQIKTSLIELVKEPPLVLNTKLSVWLGERFTSDYSTLSKTFSRVESITIEKFFLKLKIEKVKELIQQDQYTFSEIADLLDYSDSNHLAKQFKNETGMSMSDYKKLKDWNRKPLDQII